MDMRLEFEGLMKKSIENETYRPCCIENFQHTLLCIDFDLLRGKERGILSYINPLKKSPSTSTNQADS